MKKMYLVLAAIIMALSLSAFTPVKKSTETVWYDIGNGWEPITNPCPAGNTLFCKVAIGDETDVQLYRNQSLLQPVKYN